MAYEDINLDAMEADELMAFWLKTNSVRPVSFARELFPTTPKNYVKVTRDLGNYAANKATVIRCRLSGDIETALMYEGICERIYKTLPEFAQW